ncbi:glycoside hydrolase 15 protein [Vanrija albida]|uniref:glucan 1,4-alpha-glucosidase n=1 Tax=Vanrija albida TaxID=181172 RepID=A0ABR3Q0J6_9TREE
MSHQRPPSRPHTASSKVMSRAHSVSSLASLASLPSPTLSTSLMAPAPRRPSPRRAHFWVAESEDDSDARERDRAIAQLSSVARGRATSISDLAWLASTDHEWPPGGSPKRPSLLPPPAKVAFTSEDKEKMARPAPTAAAPRAPQQYLKRLVYISALTTALYFAFLLLSARSGPTDDRLTDLFVWTSTPLDRWVRVEQRVAWTRTLDNIGAAAGASDGIVVASPSKGETSDVPNYFFTWTRDSALTVSSLLPALVPDAYLRPWEDSNTTAARKENRTNPPVEDVLRSYVHAEEMIQAQSNPSGDLWTGGLSEPKFNVDYSPYTGDWGRPQRDGPALRALSLIPYANYLLDRGTKEDVEYVTTHLYNPKAYRVAARSVIKNDLEEVSNTWNRPGFDLWEELNGYHLWGEAVTRRALQAGAKLAYRLGDGGAGAFYASQAKLIEGGLPRYFSNWDQVWLANFPPSRARSGLDSATLLSAIHAGSRGVDDEPYELSPAHATVLGTVQAYIKSFDGLYEVNAGRNWTEGWLVGRYAEDVYDGVGESQGHPWFICTHSVAHVLLLAHNSFVDAGRIPLDSHTQAFWNDLLRVGDTPAEGSWTAGSGEFARATNALSDTAEAFMEKASLHVAKGRMSEQIDRDTGAQRGAHDLTWSYASFLDLARAREKAKARRRVV